MSAVNLILYADKANKKFLKEDSDLAKISKAELTEDSLDTLNDESIFLLFEEMFNDKSLKALMTFLIANQEKLTSKKKKASLVTNIELSRATEDFFQQIFSRVADIQDRFLSKEELIEAIRAENKRELAIGAAIDREMQLVTFTRGDLSKITVPFSFFVKVSDKLKIDSLELQDHGQTIKFGKFEIAFDSILYEFSAEYRKALIKKRHAQNKTFGACLRRYRKLKEISQTDFTSLSEKEISRIENEKVSPHKSTIKEILAELKMTEEELMSY